MKSFFNKFFSNIGKKIQTFVKIEFVILVILCAVLSVVSICVTLFVDYTFAAAIAYSLLAPVLVLPSVWGTYFLGKLIEEKEQKTKDNQQQSTQNN